MYYEPPIVAPEHALDAMASRRIDLASACVGSTQPRKEQKGLRMHLALCERGEDMNEFVRVLIFALIRNLRGGCSPLTAKAPAHVRLATAWPALAVNL